MPQHTCREIKKTVYFVCFSNTFIFFDHSWQSEHTNVPIKSKLEPLPSENPHGHLNFWKIFVQIPPHRAKKLLKCPTPGKITRLLYWVFSSFCYASEAVHVTWFIRQHIFMYYRYKSFFNTFKYGTQFVKAFGFQPIRHEYEIFSFEFSKVCFRRLRHDLSIHGESARFVTWNRG